MANGMPKWPRVGRRIRRILDRARGAADHRDQVGGFGGEGGDGLRHAARSRSSSARPGPEAPVASGTRRGGCGHTAAAISIDCRGYRAPGGADQDRPESGQLGRGAGMSASGVQTRPRSASSRNVVRSPVRAGVIPCQGPAQTGVVAALPPRRAGVVAALPPRRAGVVAALPPWRGGVVAALPPWRVRVVAAGLPGQAGSVVLARRPGQTGVIVASPPWWSGVGAARPPGRTGAVIVARPPGPSRGRRQGASARTDRSRHGSAAGTSGPRRGFDARTGCIVVVTLAPGRVGVVVVFWRPGRLIVGVVGSVLRRPRVDVSRIGVAGAHCVLPMAGDLTVGRARQGQRADVAQ